MTDKLIEDIADFMHDQWSHWMNYQFSKMEDTHHFETKEQTGMFMPMKFVMRWKEQLLTPYSKLSEKEKDSDRKWAKKLIDKFMLCSYCKKREKMDICNACRIDSKMWGEY